MPGAALWSGPGRRPGDRPVTLDGLAASCGCVTTPNGHRGGSVQVVVGAGDASSEKAERRVARELIGAYHKAQLRQLLEHVRSGFAKLDAGEIDEFDLDDLIHHYKRSAAALWSFCGSSGGQWLQAAKTLAYLREQGEEPDWWDRGQTRRNRTS